MNRKFVSNYPALTISLYQDAVACLILLPFVGGRVLSVSSYELGQLVLLGAIFTALARTLFIRGMLVVKAQLASVIACSEPVYGILLALALLHEIPSLRELMRGGGNHQCDCLRYFAVRRTHSWASLTNVSSGPGSRGRIIPSKASFLLPLLLGPLKLAVMPYCRSTNIQPLSATENNGRNGLRQPLRALRPKCQTILIPIFHDSSCTAAGPLALSVIR